MGEILVFIPPRLVRERLGLPPFPPPRVPRKPTAWGAGELAVFGYVIVGLLVLVALWTPIILAGAWVYRRLHY